MVIKLNLLNKFHSNSETGEWSVREKNNWILNPSFEADHVSQETIAWWKNSRPGNLNSNKALRTGNFCMQHWSTSYFKGTLPQDAILPNGTYTLKAYAVSGGNINSFFI